MERNYLTLHRKSKQLARYAIAYFAEQPSMSDWQAAVLLAWLREEHPKLKTTEWAEIANNPKFVAKLYSGYMGAGGAWDAWRNTLEPGPEAIRRLGVNQTGN